MLSPKYCEFFKNIYFEKAFASGCFRFFKAAAEQRWAAASVLTLLLSLGKLLKGYGQLTH